MSPPIEDYALIGDCESAALVARDGSIDWWCAPRFDSAACFAALLGNADHGRFLLGPDERLTDVRRTRRYRGDTMVLETELTSAEGSAIVIDFLPMQEAGTSLVRIVEGRRGKLAMQMDLRIRFDYGSIVPWVRVADGGLLAVGGPDSLRLTTPVPTRGEGLATVARFEVSAGQRIPFELAWSPSHVPPPAPIDTDAALVATEAFWSTWAGQARPGGRWPEAVTRSLLVLKALTFAPTGGIVAAPTTSLPEQIGGVRNWDYRYCWLRDATFTLFALMEAGYLAEARAWREWLLRAAAGTPAQLHLMYGITGERRLPELTLDWLPGYQGSRPVRVGNAASTQRQHDVYGELMDVLYNCWRCDIGPAPPASAAPAPAAPLEGWAVARAVVEYVETIWRDPDDGIWEVRGPTRRFTHSRMMAWVALDRAIKCIENYGVEGPVDRWRALRAEIHRDVCARGFNKEKGSFVQAYDSDRLDASLLLMPQVGFLPVTDPRVRGTILAIERELLVDGFVHRYATTPTVDGLPPGEGAFLLCTFWLADGFALLGRHADAERLFEGVLAVRNDLGLLAESYDVRNHRLVGNFPQAFSHVGLINSARLLSRAGGPAGARAG